jgi:hypothetical protein
VSWKREVLIGLDQLANALTGGVSDETISSRTGRADLNSFAQRLMTRFEADHAVRSVEYTPWGTVDPHHMSELNEELAVDWSKLVQVLESKQDLDAFTDETLASANRAAKRLRLWFLTGGRMRWRNRMLQDVEAGDAFERIGTPMRRIDNTAVEKRERVLEWRITTRWDRGTLSPLIIRYWIEADDDHDGIGAFVDARRAVDEAERLHRRELDGAQPSPDLLAAGLLGELPAANSIEVCDADGNGATIHRDWP